MHSLTKSGYFACLLASVLRPILAIQIYAGTSSLGGTSDTCSGYQEFSCVHDICDPLAGSATNGRCRNGDFPSGTCPANSKCSSPTPGRCLENTISAKGIHGTPGKGQGTPKHFSCVTVTDYDVPAVIFQNNDCTGSSCFIPGAGTWQTWSHGAQGNCISIDPDTPINTTPCLAPGQNGEFPANGGFSSDVPVPVGGDNGLPDSFDNNNICKSHEVSALPAPIARDPYNPPVADPSTELQSGITDLTGLDTTQLDPKVRRLTRRQAIPQITTTKPLRDNYPYRAVYLASTQLWWFIASGGILSSNTNQYRQGDTGLQQYSVDHLVELNMIIGFFSLPWNANDFPGISLNAYNTVQDFLKSGGMTFQTTQSGGAWCAIYDQFAGYVGGLGNLRGVSQSLNKIKGWAILAVYPGATIPNWAQKITKDEAKGVAEFFTKTNTGAREAALAIGAFLDIIAGTTPTQAISKAFSKWVVIQWGKAYTQMLSAS